MNQVSSITQAIQSAGLTPTGLADLLLNVDAEASASAKARITVILDGLCNLPLQDGRKILTETAKLGKGTPTEQTVKQRVSECRQLYGAVRLIEGFRKGIEEAGMGWSNAVSRARVELAEKHLKANGERVKTPEQVQAARVKANVLEIMAENIGDDIGDANARAESAARVEAQLATVGRSQETVNKHAARLVKDHGMDYAVAVSDAIVALYNATITEDPEVE